MSNLQLISDAIRQQTSDSPGVVLLLRENLNLKACLKAFTEATIRAHAFSGVLSLRKLIVVDNYHREDAALLQRIASLAKPWKPIRQYAILREGPRYSPIERRYGLPSAAPGACVHEFGTDSDSVRGTYTCGRMRAFRRRDPPGLEAPLSGVHKSLEGEVLCARAYSNAQRRPSRASRSKTMWQRFGEAAEVFAHVGIAEAGSGEVEEGDAREGPA
ncbi:hypothetical protein EDB83DRAFT_2313364 [Lactarius deliciosus]|nr:hypothetical protein EDB83DRAFT_2313364 [Lactarius deliciosus]